VLNIKRQELNEIPLLLTELTNVSYSEYFRDVCTTYILHIYVKTKTYAAHEMMKVEGENMLIDCHSV